MSDDFELELNSTSIEEDRLQFTKEARELLDLLEPCTEELDHVSQRFVEDLSDLFHSYGDHTYVSEKQVRWLRRLVYDYAP